MKKPTFLIERSLIAQGYEAIVGVDEAGCGALAGPVVAAAVILPLSSRIGKLHDSKLMLPKLRYQLYGLVIDRARAWSTGQASVAEIDQFGIRQAGFLAMRRAIDQLVQVDFVLADGFPIPDLSFPQQHLIGGDRKVKSIAAASIIAKVTRDRMMYDLDNHHPEYCFDQHKGYGTRLHKAMIKKYGPSPVHRMSFRPLTSTIDKNC